MGIKLDIVQYIPKNRFWKYAYNFFMLFPKICLYAGATKVIGGEMRDEAILVEAEWNVEQE